MILCALHAQVTGQTNNILQNLCPFYTIFRIIRSRSEVKSMEEVVLGSVVENKQVVFKGYIKGRPPLETDMEFKVGSKIKLEAPKGSGAIFVKNLYLSCDPYMRSRMRNFHGSYLPPFVPGSAIGGYGVSKVLDSDDPNYGPGDLVCGFTGWEEYSLIYSNVHLRKIEPDDDIPLSYHVGLLGMPGFTAYVGLHEICALKKGDYVFVSAASGAVGQLVGQIAKLHGCYVVGSAGTKHKVDLLKNKLGFDDAFNYKEEKDLAAALKRTSYVAPLLDAFQKGIDIYFDNVGGAMLDAALRNIRAHGRIALCGMVSEHSASDTQGLRNYISLLTKRVKMQGFLQGDYLHLLPRFLEDVISLYKQGKVIYIENMNEGLESGPAALVGLFTGKNVGKQVICVTCQ